MSFGGNSDHSRVAGWGNVSHSDTDSQGSDQLEDDLNNVPNIKVTSESPFQSHRKTGQKKRKKSKIKRSSHPERPKVPEPIDVKTPSQSTIVVKKSYEQCIFDRLTRKEWKKFNTLEDVLNQQLSYQGKTDRGTQTDWNWRTMAERWRHGTIITPTSVKYVTPKPMNELNDLRIIRPGIDKSVETKGLPFDPNDPNMRYTPKVPEVLEPQTNMASQDWTTRVSVIHDFLDT